MKGESSPANAHARLARLLFLTPSSGLPEIPSEIAADITIAARYLYWRPARGLVRFNRRDRSADSWPAANSFAPIYFEET